MVVLINIGKLPSYIKYTLQQIRVYNEEIKIVFIGDQYDSDLFEKYNVLFIQKDVHKLERFKKLKKLDSERNIFNTYPSKEFWLYTYARFYLLQDFINETDSKDIIFFENDIMIYCDINNIIKSLDSNLYFTVGDDVRITTGFSFISDKKTINRLIDDMDNIIFNETEIKDIRKNYSRCCPSEMIVLRKVLYNHNYIKRLPILPFDSKDKTIFDPASYGQFLDGDDKNQPLKKMGTFETNTYIAKKIFNKEIKVSFEMDVDNLKKPFCYYKGDKYKINNLHIHSKQLNKFLSK